MPEPSTAAPAEQATGTQPPQQAAAPAAIPPPAVSAPSGETTPPPGPPVADLQRQLAEITAARQQEQAQYRELQGEFTRRSQALAQLTGAQPGAPAQDPLAPYVKELTDQNYNEKDARAIVGISHKMLEPLRQQHQQAFQALQGQSLIEDAMSKAFGHAPAVFTPAITEAVRQNLRYAAANGMQITPDLALDSALLAAGRASLSAPPPQQNPPAPAPQPFANGMFRIQPAYQPAPQQAPARQPLTPEAQEFENYLKAKLSKKP